MREKERNKEREKKMLKNAEKEKYDKIMERFLRDMQETPRIALRTSEKEEPIVMTQTTPNSEYISMGFTHFGPMVPNAIEKMEEYKPKQLLCSKYGQYFLKLRKERVIKLRKEERGDDFDGLRRLKEAEMAWENEVLKNRKMQEEMEMASGGEKKLYELPIFNCIFCLEGFEGCKAFEKHKVWCMYMPRKAMASIENCDGEEKRKYEKVRKKKKKKVVIFWRMEASI